MTGIADGLESLDDDPRCRAAVLCAQGKHFCAGADFSPEGARYTTEDLYAAAVRIFRTHTPVVAAVHGAAVGGGLGLALAADFRIAAPEARFSANFARLGFHQGFGLSVTLPRLVGLHSRRPTCCSPAGVSRARKLRNWAWPTAWCPATGSGPRRTPWPAR